jgi:hypothetical protein
LLPSVRLPTAPTSVTAPAKALQIAYCPKQLRRNSLQLRKARRLCRLKMTRQGRKHWA